MWELQLIDIRPYGQIRQFGSAVWMFIFGHSVFIYSAVRFRPSGPDSSGFGLMYPTLPNKYEKVTLEIEGIQKYYFTFFGCCTNRVAKNFGVS